MNETPSELFKHWLDTQLAILAPGTRLPTDTALAAHWRVSPRFVRGVLNTQAEAGRCTRIRGRGTFAGPPPQPVADATVVPQEAHESIAAAFRAMIADGSLKRARPLPQVKFICRQFGAAPRTVISALRMLAAEGLITRAGKRYLAGAPVDCAYPRGAAQATIYNFTQLPFEEMFELSELKTPAFRYMERELFDCGYRVSYENRQALLDLASGRSNPVVPAAAVISWVDHPQFDEVMTLINAIRRTHPTMRLLLLTGYYGRPPAAIGMLCTGNLTTTRGRRVAQLVRRLGCHSVTFFQNIHNPSPAPFLHNAKLVRELLHYNPGISAAIRLCYDPQLGDPAALYTSYIGNWSRRYLDQLMGKYGYLTWEHIESLFELTSETTVPYDRYLSSDLWLFEYAAQAAAALDWLDSKGLHCPRDKQIVSLEDREEFLGRGITYCGFDWQRTGYLMAHVLIGDMPIARTHRGFVRTDALVLPRSTTTNTDAA